ncbi:MAG: flagellar biosynthetic protein FliP [Chromatiales bacterium 21-64-14]|nr:MAG: flagellar biosynthetic protein FliP [Chromatiales bacterium 21-64-14]HQU15076.1 flagellar type III secretion system pore protein FliP [Gammaproteobacteria bacterium]
MRRYLPAVLLVLLVLAPVGVAVAQPGIAAFTVQAGPKGTESYSLSLQVLALMTALTLLPAGLLMMTSFTRIIIVLSLLRQALGTMQTPSNQILIGLALFLTFFIMAPVFSQIYDGAVQPYLGDKIPVQEAVQRAAKPLRGFMLHQTRTEDLTMFMRISGHGPVDSVDQVPFSVLVPAFVTSELKTAFQIGFLLFIPFLVIDIVVASLLMSMGMIMLSPMLISLPFKILLFVLVGGWSLIMGTLASSFYM